MALNRSDIFELKGLEHHARRKKCDKGILALADELQDVLPYARQGFDKVFQIFPQIDEPFAGHLSAYKRRESTHIRCYGHGIVV